MSLAADRHFPRHDFVAPPELAGVRPGHTVAIVGAGPVGLTVACALARRGVRCVVVEARAGVEYGSRAICISRRTIEIWERLGVVAPILDKALGWTSGRSFWHGHEVLQFSMKMDGDQKHPPMINIQQCHIEQFLVEAVAAMPNVELRWQSRIIGLETAGDGVSLQVETPAGCYRLDAAFLVAADGARSFVRQALGLRLQGTSYESRYLIADISLAMKHPVERLAWFDPPSNPGSTVLMHRQPDDIWRIDFQLGEADDESVEQEESRVRNRIDRHLAMLGEATDYDVIWTSLYKAHCLSLERYRHGRVVFAGDAAHLVPIFGVRGLNSGIDDAANLSWKLAAVARGEADDRLLDSYSDERVFAAQENIRLARKSTSFMTPPSAGYALMRDAALSLAVSNPMVRPLIDPRQSTDITFPSSVVQMADPGWEAGPIAGATLSTFPVTIHDGGRIFPGHLLDLLDWTACVAVLWFDACVMQQLRDAAAAISPQLALRIVAIVPPAEAAEASAAMPDEKFAVDDRQRAAVVLGLHEPGAGYLVRPDGHVAARWRKFEPAMFAAACARLKGNPLPC